MTESGGRAPMAVSVTVSLEQDSGFTMSAEEVADAVLKAVGGDEAVDYCEAHLRVAESGSLGEPPGVAIAAAENERRLREAGELPEDHGEGVANDDAVAHDDAPEAEA